MELAKKRFNKGMHFFDAGLQEIVALLHPPWISLLILNPQRSYRDWRPLAVFERSTCSVLGFAAGR